MHPTMESINRIEKRLRQADENAEGHLDLKQPNIRVITHPEPFDNCLISTADISKFAEQELKGLGLSTIEGGVFAITRESEYWELDEYGSVYYRRKLRMDKGDETDVEHLSAQQVAKEIVTLINTATSFYEKCEYNGNIDVIATLCEVLGEKMGYMRYIHWAHSEDVRRHECEESCVACSVPCHPQDLTDKEYLTNTLYKLTDPLFKAFKHCPPIEIKRKLIEQILKGSERT